ncbi:MAG: hypothetical protein KME06_12070 [Kastovskya adunca ATA6-11-RM4]|nr:hypothetical protein [Kastovskya adunca ATA6-11-RM4]
MLEVILIFILGLIPPVLSLWGMHRAKTRSQARLRAATRAASVSPGLSTAATFPRNQVPPDRYYLDGVGYLVGDITCRYNARSPDIRCAVNPSGPCEECHHYEPKDF